MPVFSNFRSHFERIQKTLAADEETGKLPTLIGTSSRIDEQTDEHTDEHTDEQRASPSGVTKQVALPGDSNKKKIHQKLLSVL